MEADLLLALEKPRSKIPQAPPGPPTGRPQVQFQDQSQQSVYGRSGHQSSFEIPVVQGSVVAGPNKPRQNQQSHTPTSGWQGSKVPMKKRRCHEVEYRITGSDIQVVEVQLDPS
eukprot:TRINITY_DN76511_c0_g1_i1.p1 TRINITY_DN76511_c0_g1~~TRINITY_DN76511_c0_g1_i1.p1  ORF type:complete len:114 (+),score=23.66 TRINITY_DN76511_c0_g1_i1:3-344(+)